MMLFGILCFQSRPEETTSLKNLLRGAGGLGSLAASALKGRGWSPWGHMAPKTGRARRLGLCKNHVWYSIL